MAVSCTEVDIPVYDNPYDPLNEESISPEASIITSIIPNSILNSPSVSISWEGTNINSTFSYMLSGYDNAYSDWSTSKNAAYSNLDEGSYTFLVKERYSGEMEQEIPDSLSFTVNAVTECAAILRRWAVNADSGTVYSVYLDIENVAGFKGITALIEFQSTKCTLIKVEAAASAVEGSDGLLLLSNPLPEANSSGKVEINAVCLGSGEGFSGNGTLCRLEFLSRSDTEYTISINSAETVMRDMDNKDIEIIVLRGTIVN